MRKAIIILALIINAISLPGQSYTETYDYFIVPEEFVYNYTDADGYTSLRRLTVTSATLDFKDNELVRFTLKSDSNAQVSFNFYEWINNTPKVKVFFVDGSTDYFVTIGYLSDIENGLSITIRSNNTGDVIFAEMFKKRLTTEQIEEQRQKEREEARRIEEQQQKELEEAKRKADERRAKIDAFLAERTDTVYSARITDRLQYNQNNTSLSEAVASAVEYFNPQNLELSVSDSLYIDYKGNKRHSMQISSSPELPGLADAIKKNIEQCPLSPFKLNIPGTDTTCTVNSSDLYSLGYSTETESAVLRLKKVKNSTYLKSGDSQFYQNYKYGLANYLTEGDGIYEIDATVKTTNGRRTTDVTINGFRDLSPSFMMSYNYTPFAPTGVALGINNIKSSNWGAFIKMGFLGTSAIQGSPTKISNVNEIPENLLDTYGSFYLTLGTTCSVTSYGFLYAGIGIANKNWNINSSSIKTTGFNIEAGVIIRPIEWVGVSLGYNYIAGKNPFGGVNIGAILFI